jgi:hypothetical protein
MTSLNIETKNKNKNLQVNLQVNPIQIILLEFFILVLFPTSLYIYVQPAGFFYNNKRCTNKK